MGQGSVKNKEYILYEIAKVQLLSFDILLKLSVLVILMQVIY